jgi:hypothetical protein
MAIDFNKLEMPKADSPIFGGAAPQTPQLSLADATREAATARARTLAAQGAPADQIIPQATQQISAGKMADRQAQFQTAQTQAQLAEQQRQMAEREDLFRRAVQVEEENDKNIAALSAMDSGISASLFYDNLKFREDEIGRTLFNERQLVDWAVLKSKNAEDFANYEQISMQALEKKQQTLRVAYLRIQDALDKEFKKDEQLRDQKLTRLLTTAKAELEKKQRAAEAKARNTSSMWQVGGQIVGTIAGAVLGAGTPVGAAGGGFIGSAIGSGLGSIAGAGQGNKQNTVSGSDRDSVFSDLRKEYNIK